MASRALLLAVFSAALGVARRSTDSPLRHDYSLADVGNASMVETDMDNLLDSEREVQSHIGPRIPAYNALQIPSYMYGGEAHPSGGLGGARCPFAAWAGSIPESFPLLEEELVASFTRVWKLKGSPTGIQENDHDFDTSLGQGNTLGFVPATLEISSDETITKHGLFAKSSKLPAVVRFSDFGASSSEVRLARLAVKVPLADAWGGEVNLLFTESLDVFPIQDYDSLNAFVTNTAASLKQKFRMMKNPLKAVNNELRLGLCTLRTLCVNLAEGMYEKVFSLEVLAKTYYGQTPYMLGKAHAMKFSLAPLQRTCADGEDARAHCCLPKASRRETARNPHGYAAARAKVTRAFLANCDAKFRLQLQVKQYSKDEKTILHNAAKSWTETPITVGTLSISSQKVTPDTAVSHNLREVLANALHVEPDGVDKMFVFHPVATHEDNRPVGDINTFRAAFYSQHARIRFQSIHKGAFLMRGSNNTLKTPRQMPFTALLQGGVFGDPKAFDIPLHRAREDVRGRNEKRKMEIFRT